jgi:hypothetical protein
MATSPRGHETALFSGLPTRYRPQPRWVAATSPTEPEVGVEYVERP